MRLKKAQSAVAKALFYIITAIVLGVLLYLIVTKVTGSL